MVVPFFNPGPVVRTTVERAAAALAAAGISVEIIAVCDGATDGSEETLAGVLPGVLRTVVLPANRGKGFAVRTGMARGRGRLVGFIDADGDIAPEVLPDFVETAHRTGADIVFGSKRHRDGQEHAALVRRVSSWGFRIFVRALFNLSVPDTQTGVKVLRAEVARAVLPVMREERYAFDLELFVLAQRFGHASFVELPIRVDKQYTTTVSPQAASTIVRDTLNIFWRFRVRRYPRSEPRERDPMDPGRGMPAEDVDPV
ncbi:MAG: glycosyltransferase [Acidimicrobiales bacterium]